MIFRSLFRAVPQSQWKTFVQNMSNSMGFGGEVKDPQASPVEKIGEPFEFSFDYTREKLGQWDDRRINPPLPPVGWELMPGVKQIKPADDIDIDSPGDQDFVSTIQIPSGWILVPPQSVDLTEDWAEYHAKYSFKDGVFSAERRLAVKKDKMPLADWDKYLAFRRAIYEDEVRMEPIMNPAAPPPPGASAESFDPAINAIHAEIAQAMLPLRDTVLTLTANPPAGSDALNKAAAGARDVLDAVEKKSISLPPSDPHSLFWAQALANAWCVRGWTALANNDPSTAESYLRAAWRLNPDLFNGYLLARVLEAKGEKAAAAHQYELAWISGAGSLLLGFASPDFNLHQVLLDAYRRVAGKELTATPLNHGAYTGSLQAEIDSSHEIHRILHSTHLTGDGYFALAFQAGKPPKASFLSGGNGFSSLASVLEAHPFVVQLPSGSKALLLREVRMACSPWAGCDAYLLNASSVHTPQAAIPVHPVLLNPGAAPKGARSVQSKSPHA